MAHCASVRGATASNPTYPETVFSHKVAVPGAVAVTGVNSEPPVDEYTLDLEKMQEQLQRQQKELEELRRNQQNIVVDEVIPNDEEAQNESTTEDKLTSPEESMTSCTTRNRLLSLELLWLFLPLYLGLFFPGHLYHLPRVALLILMFYTIQLRFGVRMKLWD